MSQERKAICINGWVALIIHLSLLALTLFCFCTPLSEVDHRLIPFAVSAVLLVVLARGYFMLYPNTAKVMTFFGSYAGTVRHTGFLWTCPLYAMT